MVMPAATDIPALARPHQVIRAALRNHATELHVMGKYYGQRGGSEAAHDATFMECPNTWCVEARAALGDA